jgi:hypothetical protein
MEIIQQRKVEERLKYWRSFNWPGERAGFSFDSDKDGNVDATLLEPAARLNFVACLTGKVDGKTIDDMGVETFRSKVVTPKMGRCVCSAEVYLDRFTNTCSGCGRDYNSAGQELAPREQWGEETGESIEDILSVDSTSTEELLDGGG